MSSAGHTRASRAWHQFRSTGPRREIIGRPDPAQRGQLPGGGHPSAPQPPDPAPPPRARRGSTGHGTRCVETRCDTEAVVSWASSSGGRSRVLRGTRTAPMRMVAKRHDGPLGAVGRQQAQPVALDDTLGDEASPPTTHWRRRVLRRSTCRRGSPGRGGRRPLHADGPARPGSCAGQAALSSSRRARRSSLPLDIMGTASSGTTSIRFGTL